MGVDPFESAQNFLMLNSLRMVLKNDYIEEYVDPTPEWSDWHDVPVKFVFRVEKESKDPLVQIIKGVWISNVYTGEWQKIPESKIY